MLYMFASNRYSASISGIFRVWIWNCALAFFSFWPCMFPTPLLSPPTLLSLLSRLPYVPKLSARSKLQFVIVYAFSNQIPVYSSRKTS